MGGHLRKHHARMPATRIYQSDSHKPPLDIFLEHRHLQLLLADPQETLHPQRPRNPGNNCHKVELICSCICSINAVLERKQHDM